MRMSKKWQNLFFAQPVPPRWQETSDLNCYNDSATPHSEMKKSQMETLMSAQL